MPSSKQNPHDKQTGHTGKVENDTNKMGEQDPTQLNQGKRTPDSRSAGKPPGTEPAGSGVGAGIKSASSPLSACAIRY